MMGEQITVIKDSELFWEYVFAVDKKIFSDWDAFSKDRQNLKRFVQKMMNPYTYRVQSDKVALTKLVVFLYYMGVFVWYIRKNERDEESCDASF